MGKEQMVKISMEGDVAVVAFKATSISNAEGISRASAEINKFVDSGLPDKMVFDFGGVKFFSSQVLGVLLNVHSRLQEYNGEAVISGIDPHLHRIFKIANLDKIFRFFADRKSAVEQMSSS